MLHNLLNNISVELKSAGKSFVDILSPPVCFICNSVIDTYECIKLNHKYDFICPSCYSVFPETPDSYFVMASLFSSFSNDELYISKAYSLINLPDFPDYMNLVHALKYSGNRKIGLYFGKLMAEKIKEIYKDSWDWILPIPIHSAKKRERGYNQSDIIVSALSKNSHIPYSSNILKRIRYTQTQTLLSSEGRKQNLGNAFTCKYEKVIGKSILLVDDVLTTGSTLNNAAKTLLMAGALKVGAATILKA